MAGIIPALPLFLSSLYIRPLSLHEDPFHYLGFTMLTTSSNFALLLNVYLCCTSFSIVLPSLWPYIQTLSLTPFHLALIIALYSIGEAAGALIVGFVTSSANITHTSTLLLSTAVGLLGSVFYILAQPLNVTYSAVGLGGWTLGGTLVALGRFLQGVWTGGVQAVQQCYLADYVAHKQLTRFTVLLNAVACIGFVTGPVFGMFMGIFPHWSIGNLRFDDTVSPGWFVLGSGILCVITLKFGLKESEDGMHEEEGELLEEGRHVGTYKASTSSGWPQWTMCNVIMLIHFAGFALQETVTTPLVQKLYGWDIEAATKLFTFAGVCSLITFLLLVHLSTQVSDRILTMVALMTGLVGYLLLTFPSELSKWRFLLGFAVISVAFPMGRASTIALYTKLLPMEYQGNGQGLILATGAIGRIAGPFWGVRVLSGSGGGVMSCTAALFALCIGGIAGMWKRLRT